MATTATAAAAAAAMAAFDVIWMWWLLPQLPSHTQRCQHSCRHLCSSGHKPFCLCYSSCLLHRCHASISLAAICPGLVAWHQASPARLLKLTFALRASRCNGCTVAATTAVTQLQCAAGCRLCSRLRWRRRGCGAAAGRSRGCCNQRSGRGGTSWYV